MSAHGLRHGGRDTAQQHGAEIATLPRNAWQGPSCMPRYRAMTSTLRYTTSRSYHACKLDVWHAIRFAKERSSRLRETQRRGH